MSISVSKMPMAMSVADFLESINASLLSHSGRIQGEVTSVNKNYSTAIYFTIKDTKRDALLNCIIWRTNYAKNGVDLKVGDEIVVTGSPEIYVPRGTFSLKTQTIEYAGEGALKKAYEELRKKLAQEGLLDPSRKRELPKYPTKIGVITSRAGVVMQDFTANIGRYGFKITMVDSRVEGKDAIHEILAAIKTLAKQDIEVLVVMRGGGSWESLQAFNTESVVRALAQFKCPVLTGIGHDVDVTLSELVADVGASTPTAVAEALNESWDTLAASFQEAETKVLAGFKERLLEISGGLDLASSSVFRAYDRSVSTVQKNISVKAGKIRSEFMGIERKILRARSAFQNAMGILRSNVHARHKHLGGIPKRLVGFMYDRMKKAHESARNSAQSVSLIQKRGLARMSEELSRIEKAVRIADPARNLRLGYSLSYSGGEVVRSVKDLGVGAEIETHVSDGSFISEVKNIK